MKRIAVAAASAVVLGLAAAPAAQAAPACYTAAKICIDTTGSCTVGQYRTTPGGGFTCLVRRPSSARWTGPCATQRELFEKYNIEFGMHQEQVEWAYGQVCLRFG